MPELGEDACVTLVDLQESPISLRPFREEKLERVQEGKAAVGASGFITSSRIEIEAKEPITKNQASPKAKEAGKAVRKEVGLRTDTPMGTSESHQPNVHLSLMSSPTEKAEAISHEVVGAPVQESTHHLSSDTDQEVTSHSLEELEDIGTQKESGESSERDRTSSCGEDRDDSDSSHSSEESETPAVDPLRWKGFAALMAEIEPWNVRKWYGIESDEKPWRSFSRLPWGSVLPMQDRLRCSIVYASVMLRRYRRKFFRRVSAAGWSLIPKCPTRIRSQSAASEL